MAHKLMSKWKYICTRMHAHTHTCANIRIFWYLNQQFSVSILVKDKLVDWVTSPSIKFYVWRRCHKPEGHCWRTGSVEIVFKLGSAKLSVAMPQVLRATNKSEVYHMLVEIKITMEKSVFIIYSLYFSS